MEAAAHGEEAGRLHTTVPHNGRRLLSISAAALCATALVALLSGSGSSESDVASLAQHEPAATDAAGFTRVQSRMQSEKRAALHRTARGALERKAKAQVSALSEELIRSILHDVNADIESREAERMAHVRMHAPSPTRPVAEMWQSKASGELQPLASDKSFAASGFHPASNPQALATTPMKSRGRDAGIARAQLGNSIVAKGELEVNTHCQTFLAGNASADRLEKAGIECARADCKQLKSATGCKFLNVAGVCYSRPGQIYCSLNTGDPNCETKESGAVKRAMYENEPSCDPVQVLTHKQKGVQALGVAPSFTLNHNCERYVERGKERYLEECWNEDCKQSRSSVGCAFVSSAGFCYQSDGQTFCSDNANREDPRCIPASNVPPAYLKGKLCKYPAEDDPLQFAFHCTQYLITGLERDLLDCRKEDCLQARRRAPWIPNYEACNGLGCGGLDGCKYLGKEAFCYNTEGQKWCAALDKDDRSALVAQQSKGRCLTSPETPPPFLQEEKCKPEEKPEEKPEAKQYATPHDDPLKLNPNCVSYLETKQTRDLRRCEREDCLQAHSKAGCKYMDSHGFCWTPLGQAYCAKGLDKDRCHTDIGSLPPYLRSGDCQNRAAPLTINRSCQLYTYRKRSRYLWQCEREDCIQIKGLGCEYTNEDGFCYRLSGQAFCTANPGDERCKTGITNEMHERCAKLQGKTLPSLPAPSSLGLRTGFQGRFFYMKERMDRDPDLSSREPDARRTSETIDFGAVEDFELIAPDFPRNFFAAVWQGVIKVEAEGQYTFSTISEDGSHVWVDNLLVVDNGGMHGVQKVSSTVRLERGYHAVRADFFKNNGGAVMVVRWKGPDTLDKEESLPAFHFASTVQGSTVPTVGATGKVGGSPGGNEGVETGFGSGERGGEAVELPSPAAVGMRPGFLGQLFFLGEKMMAMPNTWTMTPDVSYVASTIDLTGDDDFKRIDQGMQPDYMAAVWTGAIVVETPGLYTFTVTSHDGSRLFVDGEQVVRNGGLHGVLRATGGVELGRGYHLLRVDYFKNEGVGVMSVQWNGHDTSNQDAMLDGFHFESMLTPVASRDGGQDNGVEGGPSGGSGEGRGRLPAGSSSADGSSRRGHDSEQYTKTPGTTSSGSQGPRGIGEGAGGRSDDAVKAPKVDEKSLGVPLPPPPAASHPAPTIPYDSPVRYNKEHAEGSTEDPFHFRKERRLGKEWPLIQGRSFDDLIRHNPSAQEAASQAAQVVNRQDDSLWPNYVLKTPPPLHAKENQNPHYNV